jgi:fructose-1,6-bisphosphatase
MIISEERIETLVDDTIIDLFERLDYATSRQRGYIRETIEAVLKEQADEIIRMISEMKADLGHEKHQYYEDVIDQIKEKMK